MRGGGVLTLWGTDGGPGAGHSVPMRPISPKNLLLSAAATLLLAAPASAAGAPTIVYEKLTGGLFTVDATGAGNRAVTAKGYQPEWSPDGRRILYSNGDAPGGLMTVRADGSDRRTVLRAPLTVDGHRAYALTHPTWAPDAKRVAFSAEYEKDVPGSDDGEVETVYKLATARVDGRGVRVLDEGRHPTWSPDGKRLAYVQDRGPAGARIMTIRADGTGRKVLVRAQNTFRSELDYSADGRKLLYLSNSRIRVLDLRTGRTVRVPERVADRVADATWTPDGRVAYLRDDRASGRTPPTSVFTIRADGAGNRRLFRLPYHEDHGIWAMKLSWRP